MNLVRKKLLFAAAAVTAVATVSAYPGIIDTILTINGKQASSRVRMIDGEAWVPVKDIAQAEGLTVTKSGSGINLGMAGGANQVGTLSGKVGSTLFDGRWKFTLSNFQPVDTYKIETHTGSDYGIWSPVSTITDNVITPKPGFKLYVADCTLNNGMTHEATFEWSPYYTKTAVADSSGENHPWLVWDTPSSAFVTKSMLPGSALTFKICFAVKDTATPQDVVVTLLTLGDKKGTDIRFHL